MVDWIAYRMFIIIFAAPNPFRINAKRPKVDFAQVLGLVMYNRC